MYSSLQWFRDHGFAVGDYSDAVLTAAIIEASSFIDSFTHMWFEALSKTLNIDGPSNKLLHLYIPILDLSSLVAITPVSESTTIYSLTDGSIIIYNRRYPDDRANPKIVNLNGKFPKGRQNIRLIGRFGYTDENLSYVVEEGFDPGEVGDVTFTGTGTDDLTSSGSFTGLSDLEIVVEIDSTGSPDTYKLSIDGGTTWSSIEQDLTTSLVVVVDGSGFTFASTSGHTLGDKWGFKAKALDWIVPWDIVKVVRLLVARNLSHPLEDADAQFELDQMARVKYEKTDKHAITYRDSVGVGATGATGDSVIDSILFKYRALRPKAAQWV